jgi:hypothetical protein
MRRGLVVLLLTVGVLGVAACEPRDTNPATLPGTKRVVMFGDSLPSWLLSEGPDGVDTTKYTVIDGAVSACDGTLPFHDARWKDDEVVPVIPWCKQGWRKHYPPYLQTRPDVAVIMGGTHAMLDHRIDGAWVHPCRAAARNWYYADIKARLLYLKAHADRVVVVLPAWPGPNSLWLLPADHAKRANCVREELVRAATVRNVPVVDFAAYACPGLPTACLDVREDNGIHVDPEDAADALRWLLPRVAPA